MAFVTDHGCCSSSLRRTCLVIGIVFLICGLLNITGGAVTGSSRIITALDVLFLTACICLIVATILENKYLCIPWLIGYICTVIGLIIVILADFLGVLSSDVERTSEARFGRLAVYIIKLIIETIILRYIYSYYVQLGG